MAQAEGIVLEEAQRRNRHPEPNREPDDYGIQITLFDDTASATIPYRHTGDAAPAAFTELWKYLDILERSGGSAT